MLKGRMTKAEFLQHQTQAAIPDGYKIHKFSRIRANGGITLAAVDVGRSLSFAFNLLPDFGEFTTLYDAYSIDKIEVTWVLVNNTAEEYPVLLVAPDYDDATAPATISDVTTHELCRIVPFSASKRSHTETIVPRFAATAFRTGVTSAYTWGPVGTLLDMATTDTPYYGLKYWLDNYNSVDTPNAAFRVYYTFHVRCAGVR